MESPYRLGRRQEQDTSARVQCVQDTLDALGHTPSGPIYQGANKQLAELLLSSGNDEEAIYHLSESHSPTLRNQARDRIDFQLMKGQKDKGVLQNMKERLAFEGKWHNGFSSLLKRFGELPSKWTVLQLTLQWDPLSRFPPRNRDVNRGLGVHFTRFSCGELSTSKNNLGEGGKPVSVFLPSFAEDEEQLSLMTAMRKNLSKMDNRGIRSRHQVHEECSQGIEAIVRDLETWLGGWHCLFNGRLENENLQCAIKSAVDAHIAAYIPEHEIATDPGEGCERTKQCKFNQCVTEKALSILYLVASSPFITPNQILRVCSLTLENKKFALYMSKKISDIIRSYSAALQLAKRHPVVLIIDEELDILPFEIVPALQDLSFTRMPSVHFLHALYHIHKNSTVKDGINVAKGFYVVNPTKDLPQLNALFKAISENSSVQKWEGILEAIPKSEEFLKGLQENDVFLYCGHGGGNQFVHSESIERVQIRSVVLLFGCSSSSLQGNGGRVEMSSLSYSYLLAGSPCVVGMLWQVLDSDINAITDELIKVWCSNEISNGEEPSELGDLEVDFKKMKLDSVKRKGPIRDLPAAVSVARKRAKRFLNKAALVVRGLPVNAMSKQ